MIQSENRVFIEGILSEVDLEETTFTGRDGVSKEAIRGRIKVRVDQELNGSITQMEVPIDVFSTRYTRNGTENPSYHSLREVKNSFTSIAACGDPDQADCVRISNASLQENVFYGRNDQVVSTTRISGSFVNRINRAEMKPAATFNTTFVVGNKSDEIDAAGTPTGRLNVNGVVIQYGDRADLVKFVVENENAKNHIEQYWNDGDTVRVQGKLNFSVKTEYTIEEVGFGEPIKTAHTTSVHDLIITSGSAAGLKGEAAYDITDIQSALAARKIRIEETKKPAKTLNQKPNFGF